MRNQSKYTGRIMKKGLMGLAVASWLVAISASLSGQGYILPNGVVTNVFPGEISVLHDPTNQFYTGFVLDPQGASMFKFYPVVDIGVRVFLVSANDPISL